jgi:hypothetical protein
MSSGPRQTVVESFLGPQNESMLERLLYQDMQRRVGNDLTEKQRERLVKTVRHYMREVQEKVPGESVQVKNKEVLTAVVPDYLSYIRRSSVSMKSEDDSIKLDVSTRFSQLQNERNPKKSAPPAPPDFRIPLNDEGPVSMGIFEEIKKQRDDEQRRADEMIATRISSDRNFQQGRETAAASVEQQLSTRELSRQSVQRESANEFASRMVAPDPRRMFMKDVLEGNPAGTAIGGTTLESIFRSSNPMERSGLANTNMTLALPGPERTRPALPQDNLIPQDDILTYKENEYNLFIWSADRDWLNDSRTRDSVQNRYNFVVNFDPANNRPGQLFGVNAAASIKFKNITRIEFVKAILPVEGVNNIVRKIGTTTYDVSLNVNILSFPYLNLYVKELDNNGYGTDFYFERSFGTLQYDANWISDNSVTTKGGYLAMIPKFLKCQKVYHPTPLSTLQKMSIRLERPNGNLVSDIPDTFDVSGLVSSKYLGSCPAGSVTSTTKYVDTSGYYIWIETSSYFSRFAVNTGDWVRFQGLTMPASYTGNQAAIQDMLNWLQTNDHLVVGVAYNRKVATTGVSYYTDGNNTVGYANYIIIQSRFNDPTTGSILPTAFGGLGSSANDTFLSSLCGNKLTAGKFINLSHQTHLVFRIITRDLDSTSRLRPDNL